MKKLLLYITLSFLFSSFSYKQILGKELRVYAQSPDIIKKNRELLKDLIQLLFKYLMDGNKNSEEDIIGVI